MKDFEGKVAIVTGGASGIGRALCEELIRRRAIVIIADLNGDEANLVERALTDAGGSASAATVDVAKADSVQELVDDTLARYGRVDLAFNNAGIGWTGDFLEMSPDQSGRVVDINLKGVIHGFSAVYPIMVKQGTGHIVNTSSFFSGLVPIPGMSVYSSTKHALVALSLALREEARMFGVNVSVVCPSFISTNIDENSELILRGRTTSVESASRSNPVDAAALAKAILDGVSRNRAIIIRPSFIRPFWWLYRLSPWLYLRIQAPFVMRRMHREQTSRVAAVVLRPVRWLSGLLLGRRRK